MRLVPLLPFLLSLLAGCAVSARPASAPLPPMNVRPLYAELTHYDRAIAALQATERSWNERERAATLARDRAGDAAAFAHARATLATLLRRSRAYSGRENAALSTLQSSAALSSSAALPRYRSEILSNERRAIAQTRAAAVERVSQADALRQQQLDEDVSTLAWRLTQRDAIRTMLLRVRADDLHNSAAQRRSAQRKLSALLAQEQMRLAGRRVHDARVLAAYRAALVATAATQSAHTIAQIRARTQANLAARQRIAPAREPSIAGALRVVRSSQRAPMTNTSAAQRALVAAQQTTGDSFAAIAAADRAAAVAVHAEIVRLRTERRALYGDIVEYERERAASSARTRHHSKAAFRSVKRPAIQ